MKACGIDPGSSASVAVFCPDVSFESGLRWQLFDVPKMRYGATGERVDAPALSAFLQRTSPDRVFVELVGPMGDARRGFRQNNNSFIRACGFCEAVPLALGFPVVPIAPRKWKRYFEIPSYGDDTPAAKEHSRVLMIQLEPKLRPWLGRKKDHGRAEAALIAMYGAHCMAAYV